MRGWPRTKWIWALGAGLALVFATNAFAHDEGAPSAARMAQARAALETGMTRHAAHGFHRERAMADNIQALATNSGFIWPVTLRAGVSYRIYGACDSKCSDLDLEIYGADGKLADSDTGGDTTPYVQVTPTQTGTHYVRFWIFSCDEDPCVAAVRIVSGGQATPRSAQREESEDSEDYVNTVKSELDDAGEAQIRNGYTQFGADEIAPVTMQSNGQHRDYALDAGRAYVFVGACDQDCDDADMEILDAHGNQVASDVASDDRPVVGITPPRAGEYTVRIWLANCSQEPCYVGFRSLRRTPDYHPGNTWPPAPQTPEPSRRARPQRH